MKRSLFQLSILLLAAFAGVMARAQKAPPSPEQPWAGSFNGTTNLKALPGAPAAAYRPDATKIYTLAELIDLAEHNNPDTRVAWEAAVSRAAAVGISKSTLYPTVAAE